MIFVVEIFAQENNRYEPTVGVALTEHSAKLELEQWQQQQPKEKFRLTAYAPKGEIVVWMLEYDSGLVEFRKPTAKMSDLKVTPLYK